MTEAEREREAIVAFMRNAAEGFHIDLLNGLWGGDTEYPKHAAESLDWMADAIERGDHLQGEGM